MDQLLIPVQTRHISNSAELESRPADLPKAPEKRAANVVTSPDEALEILKSKPDQGDLIKVLNSLDEHAASKDGFSIRRTSAKAAQVLFVLVNEIVPDFWDVWSNAEREEKHKGKRLLAKCLHSLAAINALNSRLRLLLDQLKDPQYKSTSASDRSRPLVALLEVLQDILRKDETVTNFWRSIQDSSLSSTQKSLEWKEHLSLIASGRLLSTASEAESAINEISSDLRERSWLSDGSQYASWLGRNVQYMVNDTPPACVEDERAVAQVLSKALKLGYVDAVVQGGFADSIAGNDQALQRSRRLVAQLLPQEQKKVLFTFVRVLEKRHLSFNAEHINGLMSKTDGVILGGVAALIAELVEDVAGLVDGLVEWLTGVSAEAIKQTHSARVAVVSALSLHNENLETALRKAMELFGDKVFIKHTPIFQQEVNAQVILLLLGRVHDANPSFLVNMSQSSLYLNAISNHLASASQRARFLGMVVGMATSELVDSKDKRMNFSSEDMESSQGRWYRNLTSINPQIGSIQDLSSLSPKKERPFPRKGPATPVDNRKKVKPRNQVKGSSKIISIEEVDDSSSEDEDDLPTYQKPGSDPEDSDEDPELITRNRPTAPVYIRDLLSSLRDLDNYDRHRIALTNAASLIRRKAVFGTEVTDNILDLATIFVGLNDKWEMDSFQRYRLQAMIAILVASPQTMGPWFAHSFYNGDYSISQRASVLTTLGLGAREIAGLGKEDAGMTGSSSEDTFPTKLLPANLHKHYSTLPSSSPTPIDALSSQLEKAMIRPLAASAADQITGPNALKVRTFSSRMEVEKKRAKPTPNALAKIVAESFFFPLVGRWSLHLHTHGSSSTTATSPYLLTHLLRTLALILHASGSTSPALPQITSEFWSLLLSVRARAGELPVLEALLFAVLTLLEVNGDQGRRIAEEHGRELLETQAWVEGLFERLGGGSAEDEKVRMLAAGVLLRVREVVEKEQRLLMGEFVDYL